MELTISILISSALEILAFGVVPFIWWFFTSRKRIRFLEWVGLKGITKPCKKGLILVFLCTLLFFLALTVLSRYMLKDVKSGVSEFEGLGVAGLLPAIIFSVFNTSFPEELLFRGFLQKRLAARFGFLAANIIQSSLFGLIHGIMFFGPLGVIKALLVTVFTGTGGFAMAYINEKKADGSILPSWIIHGVTNFISTVFALFSII